MDSGQREMRYTSAERDHGDKRQSNKKTHKTKKRHTLRSREKAPGLCIACRRQLATPPVQQATGEIGLTP